MSRRLAISFSGGKTSAFMTWWLLTNARHLYDEIVVTFANTGEEREETLMFILMCDCYFGFNTIWLEAVVDPQHGKGTRHRRVTYETASRKGEPFESVIAKYGIPNVTFQPCNRELKLHAMRSYIRHELGWEAGSYDTAIGIRMDETRRAKVNADAERIVYPLIDLHPSDKLDVNDFWDEQPFTLELSEYEGNCKTCWKKSLKKLLRIAQEHPEFFEFNRRMEAKHGFSGARTDDGKPRVFFRGNRSTDDILKMAGVIELVRVDQDADQDAGCSESCEVFES